MNAATIPFGIELETTIPSTDETPIGAYHHGLPVAWLPGYDATMAAQGIAQPNAWKVERDGSIHHNPGRRAAEFVSPVLQGEDGIEQAATVAKTISQRGGRVNPSCGLHVSVTFNGDAVALARLITLVANHEKAIYAATGTKARERSQYCKPVKAYGNDNSAKFQLDRDRYHMLNLTHIAAGKNRIEFRAFAGTLNPLKIKAYIQLCLALVELATTTSRKAKWSYERTSGTQSPWDRNGTGETELVRLFYRIGWTKGRTNHAFGLITTTKVRAMKDELVRLARQYDAAR